MEFKFRTVDPPPPTFFSPPSSSSNINYLSGHAFRGNCQMSESSRQDQELLVRNEKWRREMEMISIAEEMMMRRRRILEEEIRGDIMAMRMGHRDSESDFSLKSPPSSFSFMNRFDHNRWFDGSVDHQSLLASGCEEDKKGKIIELAKPDPNHCGVKRKASMPAAGGAEFPRDVSNKKPKEEWSCALCQVSATSENGLNDHLKGKRHKAKEARLRPKKMAKNLCFEPLPKKILKQTKLAIGTADLELELEDKGKPAQVNENKGDTDKKNEKNDAVEDGDKLQVKENKRAKKHLKKKKAGKRILKEKRRAEFKMEKKFKSWCEICRIGAYSAVVMEAHKKGKKHLAQLREFGQSGGVVSTITALASSSEAGDKVKDAESVTEEKMMENAEKTTGTIADNEMTTENVAGNEKTENIIIDIDGPDGYSMIN